jgi:hypothetical protein
MAYNTGYAWLDGTPSMPERVLSGYQTQLFEDMIATLHAIKTVNIGSVSRAFAPDIEQSANGFSIGEINVSVEKLDSDADYEELAERVGEVLSGQIRKTMSVGGLLM